MSAEAVKAQAFDAIMAKQSEVDQARLELNGYKNLLGEIAKELGMEGDSFKVADIMERLRNLRENNKPPAAKTEKKDLKRLCKEKRSGVV